MSISYPLTHPTSPKFKKANFRFLSATAKTESPFTFDSQVVAHQGGKYEITLTLPTMTQAQAQEWIGFLTALNGFEGTFLVGDPDRTFPRGIGTGTPLIKGGSQTGKTITTDGWTASQTGILLRGDLIQIGNYFYTIAEDADSDGSGNATLEIEPRLRSSPSDNDPITVTNPKTLVRLKSNIVEWNTDALKNYEVTFTVEEAI